MEAYLPKTTASTDTDLYTNAAADIIDQYRQRIEVQSARDADPSMVRGADDAERRLRVMALRAERDTYYRIAQSGELPDEMARIRIRELDLQEAQLTGRLVGGL